MKFTHHDNLFNPNSNSNQKIPWRSILTSVPVWALVVTHFGQNWGYYTLLTQMPRYFQQVLRFDLKEVNLTKIIPIFL